jgi:hypothetical protein
MPSRKSSDIWVLFGRPSARRRETVEVLTLTGRQIAEFSAEYEEQLEAVVEAHNSTVRRRGRARR